MSLAVLRDSIRVNCKDSDIRKFRRIFLLLFSLFPGACAMCQSTGSLSGKVINAKTGEPVSFATVFLANTMIGASAKEDGTFLFHDVPVGKYNLTVSSIGYTLKTIPLPIVEGSNTLDIQLEPETTLLKEVEVKAKRSDYYRQLGIFKQYFLGKTSNASKCTIKNIDDIDFEYDEKTKVLTASATHPLEIENLALGYRVFYVLQDFKVDFNQKVSVLAGQPRFESLTPENERQLRHWTRARDRAYYGSLNHFMRSLKFHTLKESGFLIYLVQKDGDIPIDESILFAKPPDSYIQLKIVYTLEVDEFNNARRGAMPPQVSYLSFTRRSLVIYDNGYYENPMSFKMDGYFNWSEKLIGELLPLEYLPVSKRKKW